MAPGRKKRVFNFNKLMVLLMLLLSYAAVVSYKTNCHPHFDLEQHCFHGENLCIRQNVWMVRDFGAHSVHKRFWQLVWRFYPNDAEESHYASCDYVRDSSGIPTRMTWMKAAMLDATAIHGTTTVNSACPSAVYTRERCGINHLLQQQQHHIQR